MPDSVPDGDTLGQITTLELLGDRWAYDRDARAAWAAIELCTAEARPLPDWAANYLANVARQINTIHRRDNPLTLWRALGLYGERDCGYDADNDPEFIHARIAQMKAEGEVRTIAEGARLYVARYRRANDPESIRKRYYEGRRKAGPPPDGAETRLNVVRPAKDRRSRASTHQEGSPDHPRGAVHRAKPNDQ